MKPTAVGPYHASGTPRLVFQGRFRPAPNARTPWDLAADGRFLRVQQSQPQQALDRIDVVLNWTAEVMSAAAK